jgi:hypothetical protein
MLFTPLFYHCSHCLLSLFTTPDFLHSFVITTESKKVRVRGANVTLELSGRRDKLRLERVRTWGLVVLEIMVSNLLHLWVLDGAFETFFQKFGVLYLVVLKRLF